MTPNGEKFGHMFWPFQGQSVCRHSPDISRAYAQIQFCISYYIYRRPFGKTICRHWKKKKKQLLSDGPSAIQENGVCAGLPCSGGCLGSTTLQESVPAAGVYSVVTFLVSPVKKLLYKENGLKFKGKMASCLQMP